MADHDEAGEAYEMGGENNFRGILAGGRDRIAAGRKGRARTVSSAYRVDADAFRNDIARDMRDPRYDSTRTPPDLANRVAWREEMTDKANEYLGKASD